MTASRSAEAEPGAAARLGGGHPRRVARRGAVLLLAASALVASGPILAGAADPPDGPRTLTLEQARARWSDAASRFVELDGVRVHYKDEGEGPVVLLVHGSMGDLADWDGWVAALSGTHRLIRFDRPGAGLSGPMPNDNYSLDRQLALVDALVDELGVERFAIAGASLGGPVAFRYAATRSERVSALVLVNSAGIEFGGRQGTTRQPSPASYGWMTAPTITRAEMRRSLAAILNDPAKLTDAFVERKFQLHAIEGREREGLLTVQQYERGTPERVLARVRAPTLVLWGGANRALSTETADAFAGALARAPVARRVVHEGAGHMLHVERPARTAAEVGEFLAAHAQLAAAPGDAARAHWRRLEGTWVADAGYANGALVPILPRYGAVLRVAREGESLVQTEWKYYPPSPLARSIGASFAAPATAATGGGAAHARDASVAPADAPAPAAPLADDEGLLLISRIEGRPVGADGALDFGGDAGRFLALDVGTAVGTVQDGARLRYRVFDTFADDDRFVRTTLGFAADGSVQGVSVFRYRRVAADALAAEQARLGAEYATALVVDRTGAAPVLTRVEGTAAR